MRDVSDMTVTELQMAYHALWPKYVRVHDVVIGLAESGESTKPEARDDYQKWHQHAEEMRQDIDAVKAELARRGATEGPPPAVEPDIDWRDQDTNVVQPVLPAAEAFGPSTYTSIEDVGPTELDEFEPTAVEQPMLDQEMFVPPPTTTEEDLAHTTKRVGGPVLLVAAGVVALVVVGAILVTRGGDDGGPAPLADAGTTAQPTTSLPGPLVSPPLGRQIALPSACDVLSAGFVGATVHKTMTAQKLSVGTGCRYRGTPGQPDLSTAYPPDIYGVQVSYTAPNGALTADGVRQLFQTSRGQKSDAEDIPGAGEAAFGSGTDVTVLDRGVMVSVSTSGTLRPESYPEVQQWCVRIAAEFRAKLS
jgi:hypothetical protein